MHLRAISFRDAQVRQSEATGTRQEAIELGRRVARHSKGVSPKY
jgi:hypothetical protein